MKTRVHPRRRAGLLASDLPRQRLRAKDRDAATESEHPGDERRADRNLHLHIKPAVAAPLAALRGVNGAFRDEPGDVGFELETDPARSSFPRAESALHEARGRDPTRVVKGRPIDLA